MSESTSSTTLNGLSTALGVAAFAATVIPGAQPVSLALELAAMLMKSINMSTEIYDNYRGHSAYAG